MFRGTASLSPPPGPLPVIGLCSCIFWGWGEGLFFVFHFPHSCIYYLDFFCKQNVSSFPFIYLFNRVFVSLQTPGYLFFGS